MGSALNGRKALVTGASRGIGRAIAQAFAGEGASVALTARTAPALEAAAAEIRREGHEAFAVSGDLTAEDDIRRIAAAALEKLGAIDILVNNAAIIHPFVDLVDFDPSLWRRVIEMNLLAPALLTRAVLPSMIAARRGKIINISSIGGRRGGKGRSAYRAAKAALINLTESVAAEVKPHGIDVLCICPGGVETEGVRAAFGARLDDQRLMQPAEIAALALFLACDASSAITGTAIDAFGWTNPVFKDS